jgi:DNA-directed RNA polymerase subunit alpha
VGELVSRSEADLLDIRNFGAKSIDEVKLKLVGLGLALKDSPPGFDPTAAATSYDGEGWSESVTGIGGGISDEGHDDGQDYAETEQL